MLAARVLTSLIGLAVLLSAVLLGPPFLAGLATLAGVIAVTEFQRLCRAFDHPPRLLFSLVIMVAIVQAALWDGRAFLVACVCGAIAMGLFHLTAPGPGLGRQLRLTGAAGPFYIGMPLGAAVYMLQQDAGQEWLLTALFCTMAVDTGAYAIGKLIGRRPLTAISPNKTWEGTIGGMAAGTLTAVGLTLIWDLGLGPVGGLGLGLTVGIAAVFGDLAVSSLKRLAQVKDTGTLLPGHGGILDRMDSLLLSIPFALMWMTITGVLAS